jgi:signal transduction histidine kinase
MTESFRYRYGSEREHARSAGLGRIGWVNGSTRRAVRRERRRSDLYVTLGDALHDRTVRPRPLHGGRPDARSSAPDGSPLPFPALPLRRSPQRRHRLTHLLQPVAHGLVAALADALLIAIPAAWMTRRLMGRKLHAIATIRAELGAANLHGLSTPVAEPPGDNEVVQLARTINGTLGRLEQAEERAEQALDQQRQFTADASHELCTPLAGLRVRLEEALMHPDDIDLPDLLDHALGDLDRMQNLVTDLLLLARLGVSTRTTLEKVDLTALVQTEVAHRIDGHEIQLHLDPAVTVDAVPPQITRILANLLDNAQRHAAHTICIDLRRTEDSAELTIADDGEGIAQDDRERIFHRFVRLDSARSRDRGGTGLGLAIARDIASAHKSSLDIEDSTSGGVCFVLRIPLAANHPHSC